MCGISGIWNARATVPAEKLQAETQGMAAALGHRGPDDQQVWTSPSGGVGLGHTRLAILDLSPTGRQPMLSPCGRWVIVYNGEIYNHAEIRARLAQAGMTFRGHSDTEVLLGAIERWGLAAALPQCVGMFAFALWDNQEKTLSLARDRLGEKPLYYGWSGEVFLFGSELKALRAHPAWKGEINREAIGWLMRHDYVPAPESIYQGIAKLEPGCWLTLTRDQALNRAAPPVRKYWDLAAVVRQAQADLYLGEPQQAVARLGELLKNAVALQMMADVPVGTFLSGGVDSSLVTALMQAQSRRPIKTFTIGFAESQYNEAVHAQAVAKHLGTDHTELYVSPADALAVIPRLAGIYDEPFADSSQIPTYLVAALARQQVKVSLSGDGGDELFGGYTRYQRTESLARRLHAMPRPARVALGRLLGSRNARQWQSLCNGVTFGAAPAGLGDKLQRLGRLLRDLRPSQLYANFSAHHFGSNSLVLGDRTHGAFPHTVDQLESEVPLSLLMSAMDLAAYLPDNNLVKVDRAAMAVGLETRVPLLDHRIVEFALGLPTALKVRDGQTKWPLRQVLYQHVPRALIERPKKGFGIPLGSWLRGPLRDWAETLLAEPRLQAEGYFSPREVRQLWSDHLAGRRDCQFYLWDILMFQAWLEQQ